MLPKRFTLVPAGPSRLLGVTWKTLTLRWFCARASMGVNKANAVETIKMATRTLLFKSTIPLLDGHIVDADV